MLRERAVICRLNARWRKCTKMFTEALDLMRLSTVQSLSSSLLRRRITNVCWRPKCRCNGNRPGRAGAPSKGSQSQERNGQVWFSSGISFGYTRDTIVSAVRSLWNETLALTYLAFLEKRQLKKKKGSSSNFLWNNCGYIICCKIIYKIVDAICNVWYKIFK